MIRLTDLLDAGHVALELQAHDLESLISALVQRLIEQGYVGKNDGAVLAEALLKRERLAPTCVGQGVAVPHAYISDLPQPSLLLARLAKPLAYGQPVDNEPLDLIFLLIGPDSARVNHMRVLARIVRLMHDERWLQQVREATTAEAIINAVHDVEMRHG